MNLGGWALFTILMLGGYLAFFTWWISPALFSGFEPEPFKPQTGFTRQFINMLCNMVGFGLLVGSFIGLVNVTGKINGLNTETLESVGLDGPLTGNSGLACSEDAEVSLTERVDLK